MNADPMLDGVLGPDDSRFASSLSTTLQAARRRRHRRQAARGAAVMAILSLVTLTLWRQVVPRQPENPLAETADPTALDAARPAFDLVKSTALPASMVLETRPNPAVSFATRPGASVEWIDDDQLLALAPGCLALTRSARGKEFVALCQDLIGSL